MFNYEITFSLDDEDDDDDDDVDDDIYRLSRGVTSTVEETAGQEFSHDKTFIKNGNIVKKLQYLNNSYAVFNTCAFDSIIVGIVVACNDNNAYRMEINTENEFLNLAKRIILNAPKEDIYIIRFLLLLQHFEMKMFTPMKTFINAQCNITKIINNYLKTDPSCIQIMRCTRECVGERFKCLPTIILKDRRFISFKYLDIMLENYASLKSRHCTTYNCKGIRVVRRLFEDHIFIETEMFSNGIYRHKLSDFSEIINVADKR